MRGVGWVGGGVVVVVVVSRRSEGVAEGDFVQKEAKGNRCHRIL